MCWYEVKKEDCYLINCSGNALKDQPDLGQDDDFSAYGIGWWFFRLHWYTQRGGNLYVSHAFVHKQRTPNKLPIVFPYKSTLVVGNCWGVYPHWWTCPGSHPRAATNIPTLPNNQSPERMQKGLAKQFPCKDKKELVTRRIIWKLLEYLLEPKR